MSALLCISLLQQSSGIVWDSTVVVRETTGTVLTLRPVGVAADSDFVYLLCDSAGGGVYIMRSTDTGLTFPTGALLVTGGSSVAIAAQRGNVYVVYRDSSAALRLIKSTDYGATWPVDTVIGPLYNSADYGVLLAAGDTLLLRYFDELAVPHYLTVMRSVDGGYTWARWERPSYRLWYPHAVDIVLGSDTLYMLLRDTLNQEWLFKGADRGATWDSLRLTFLDSVPPLGAGIPLAWQNGALIVAWGEDSVSNTRVYSATSIDGGKTWTNFSSAPSLVATFTTGYSVSPSRFVREPDALFLFIEALISLPVRPIHVYTHNLGYTWSPIFSDPLESMPTASTSSHLFSVSWYYPFCSDTQQFLYTRGTFVPTMTGVTKPTTLPLPPHASLSRRGDALRLTLSTGADVSLAIYDAGGRRAALLERGHLNAGDYSYALPRLPRGLYLAHLAANGARRTLPLLVR